MASLQALIDAFMHLTQSQVKNLDGEPESQVDTLETPVILGRRPLFEGDV